MVTLSIAGRILTYDRFTILTWQPIITYIRHNKMSHQQQNTSDVYGQYEITFHVMINKTEKATILRHFRLHWWVT